MNEITDWLQNIFFARHETFCPRYGWLKKGFDAVHDYEKPFERPDAIELLGVGKNMVRSIRFWCMAFNILEPVKKEKQVRLGGKLKPTKFAESIFANDTGWDPFLEDPGSLWLVHWQLFMPPVLATAWTVTFNTALSHNFTSREIANAISERLDRLESRKPVSFSSIEKDASCLIRMYAHPRRKQSDEIECPFTQLDLLRSGDEDRDFSFNNDNKPTLPDAIFLAACFDYAAHTQPTLQTLSLPKIVYGFNSPGVVFKITESEAGHRLEKSVNQVKGVEFTESYGNRQLQFNQSPARIRDSILEQYYRSN